METGPPGGEPRPNAELQLLEQLMCPPKTDIYSMKGYKVTNFEIGSAETKNLRHLKNVKLKKLSEAGNVEPNPGPSNRQTEERSETKLIVVTQNCRGITEERKLKHLLNNCYRLGKTTRSYIIALQETMITSDQRIKFRWRGNHVFTPGSGDGRGCLTLLPVHVQPDLDTLIHLDQRGHIFKVSLDQSSAIIANLYAPTGQPR